MEKRCEGVLSTVFHVQIKNLLVFVREVDPQGCSVLHGSICCNLLYLLRKKESG